MMYVLLLFLRISRYISYATKTGLPWTESKLKNRPALGISYVFFSHHPYTLFHVPQSHIVSLLNLGSRPMYFVSRCSLTKITGHFGFRHSYSAFFQCFFIGFPQRGHLTSLIFVSCTINCHLKTKVYCSPSHSSVVRIFE